MKSSLPTHSDDGKFSAFFNPVWDRAVENLEKVMSAQNFETWIKPLSYSHGQNDAIVLMAPNSLIKEWVEDNYREMLIGAVSIAAGRDIAIDFSVDENNVTPEYQNVPAQEAPTEEIRVSLNNPVQEFGVTPLNPKYTFDLFVNGSSNQFAHAASLAVANTPADVYNPLFIYGGSGLGKSHLLNAIGHEIIRNNPSKRVCYCSAEKFMYEMVNYLKQKKMEAFKDKFRNVDVLLVDDIQFISGKPGTQEEFFHTFNALHESHKQIVITSDKFPREIPELEERLRTRFEWGLIADIQPPDLETKIAILKKKAEFNKINLPDNVAYFLASTDSNSIRELEGRLIRLGAFSSLQSLPITLEMAKERLKDIIVEKRREITVELIQKAVSDHLGIKTADLKSKARLKSLVLARQIAIKLCRDMTTASYPDIGAKFGGKDHSTVIHAFKKIEKMMAEDQKLVKTVEDIKHIILK